MIGFLNAILVFSLSMVMQSAGVTGDTWQYWVVIVLVLALAVVQYIPS